MFDEDKSGYLEFVRADAGRQGHVKFGCGGVRGRVSPSPQLMDACCSPAQEELRHLTKMIAEKIGG